MLRGQSEVISTAIIVAVAVALALGVVYYLTPLVVSNRVAQQLQMLLLDQGASLSVGIVYSENTTTGQIVVAEIRHLGGTGSFNVYAAVIALGGDGLPVAAINASFYLLNESASVASATGSEGWIDLNATGRLLFVTPGWVYMYVKDGYYVLSGLSSYSGGPVLLADLGLVRPGDVVTLKVEYDRLAGCDDCVYVLSLFSMVNGRFYEVRRVVLG